ncbi:unnamed protein product [Vitrella brassicaformis CCMP3155]|uniref:Uncharacterized protein n=1 Tax=Vitrella brassicaformis (strain CCMP3155) TaxID=1169540 RepID=A0A0G4GSU4_VITBC|nr:unnamed protein product [Vitrella brassicaformis CCMP3155]|eukprot:CEM33706.1 unnamed protein product [Vitrella brassicaformis CCMP3155]
MASQFPFFRITVVGAGGCGKTSIINMFVNNYCPVAYEETEWPALYYKTVRLSGEEEEGRRASVVVEVEDTYASNRGDDDRNVKRFLSMERTEIVIGKGKDATPFGLWSPPLPAATAYDHNALTRGRMGYMIVFDVTDKKSFDEACGIYLMLQEELEKKREKIKPIVFLVANKIDKESDSPQVRECIQIAEAYSQKMMLRLYRVSAIQNKAIKKLFRDMLTMIRGHQLLWMMEGEEEEVEEEGVGREQPTMCAVM